MQSFIESCFKTQLTTGLNSALTNERVPTATQCKSRSWTKLKESHLDIPLEVLVIQNHDFYDTLYLYITLVPYSCISSADFLEKYTRKPNIRLGHQEPLFNTARRDLIAIELLYTNSCRWVIIMKTIISWQQQRTRASSLYSDVSSSWPTSVRGDLHHKESVGVEDALGFFGASLSLDGKSVDTECRQS